MRGDQQLTEGSSNPELGEYEGSIFSFTSGPACCFQLSPQVLCSIGPWRSNGRSGREEFEDNESGISVSETFCTGLVGCPR